MVLEPPQSHRQIGHTAQWGVRSGLHCFVLSTTYTQVKSDSGSQVSRGAGRRRAGSGPDKGMEFWFLPSQVASCLATLARLGTWKEN